MIHFLVDKHVFQSESQDAVLSWKGFITESLTERSHWPTPAPYYNRLVQEKQMQGNSRSLFITE
jgi:hypothetical protein